MATDYTILLPFLDRTSTRPALNQLNREGGCIVACNGYAVARLPDDGTHPVAPASIGFSEMLAKYPPQGAFVALSTATRYDTKTCEDCMGTGHAMTISCPDCEGEGAFDHGNHTYHCKRCDGCGEATMATSNADEPPCSTCGGSGKVFKNWRAPCRVLGHPYAPKYIAMLSRLPDLRVAHAGTPEHPAALRFEFAGNGTGLLLGWRE